MKDDVSLDLKLARQARDEAAADRKAAAADREAAAYDRGQIEHAKRFIEQTERGISEREHWLAQHGEAEVRARVAAADKAFAEARELMQAYNADKHGAAIALQQINEREKREQAA
jgi:hypothetical protein